jgi:dTMP kinase
MTALAETFLFEAARAQLVDEVIRPALARGAWVICDRFSLSTLVYQGIAGGIKPRVVEQLSAVATGGLWPDRYLVLWVPVSVGHERRAGRAADSMESKGAAFLCAVANAYRLAARKHPRRYRLVDGTGTVQAVRARIWRHVEALLP